MTRRLAESSLKVSSLSTGDPRAPGQGRARLDRRDRATAGGPPADRAAADRRRRAVAAGIRRTADRLPADHAARTLADSRRHGALRAGPRPPHARSTEDSIAGTALLDQVAAEHPGIRKVWVDDGYRQYLVEHAATLRHRHGSRVRRLAAAERHRKPLIFHRGQLVRLDRTCGVHVPSRSFDWWDI